MPSPDPNYLNPTFGAQVNIIHGGALLCSGFHHSVVDARGFANILGIWAGQCYALSYGKDQALPLVDDSDLDRQQISGHKYVSVSMKGRTDYQ